MNKCLSVISTLLLIFSSSFVSAKDVHVDDAPSLEKAIKMVQAGDTIVLKNGTYSDINIVFYGEGTKEKPITLKAETPGKVFIEGQSNLHIGGTYMHVDGLYFRNGYSPTKSVIRFMVNKKKIAFHSKVTNSVIEDFTNIDREVKGWWVEFWGQHNELSNSYLAGKSTPGPVIMVQLKGNQHINNHHQIVNNYFGERPRQGGPHGEVMQLGDSGTSMTPSYTNIENNLFEYCNGEVEIISSKSNYNQFKNNVFFESEGSLVLRHGNYANIDGNVFIGDGENKFIGGIRVINTGHWITNNYFYKIVGEKFRAPLGVMNGIPKSPLNRYNQVTDIVVAYNTWVDSPTPWYFSVGSNVDQAEVLPKSEIRSARPKRSIFANNLIYNTGKSEQAIFAYDKVDGIKFYRNYSNQEDKSGIAGKGLKADKFKLVGDGVLKTSNMSYEKLYDGFGFERIEKDLLGNKRSGKNNAGALVKKPKKDFDLLDRSKYGAPWFSTEKEQRTPSTLNASTTEELLAAVKSAQSGDTIKLAAGEYQLDSAIEIAKELTLLSDAGSKKTIIKVSSPTSAFTLLPKSYLKLDGVSLVGDGKQDAFATLDKHMYKAYDLSVANSKLSNFNNILRVSRTSFADEISIDNTAIENSKNGFMLNMETKNKGTYNVEFLTIKNSSFDGIDGAIIDYHRGGYDESTIGGNLVFENNTVTNSGKSQPDKVLIKNRGIVHVSLADNTFKNNPVDYVAVLWGEKGQSPVNNKIKNSGEVKVVQNLKLELMY